MMTGYIGNTSGLSVPIDGVVISDSYISVSEGDFVKINNGFSFVTVNGEHTAYVKHLETKPRSANDGIGRYDLNVDAFEIGLENGTYRLYIDEIRGTYNGAGVRDRTICKKLSRINSKESYMDFEVAGMIASVSGITLLGSDFVGEGITLSIGLNIRFSLGRMVKLRL